MSGTWVLWDWAGSADVTLEFWLCECVCAYLTVSFHRPEGAVIALYFHMLESIYIYVHGSLAMQMWRHPRGTQDE